MYKDKISQLLEDDESNLFINNNNNHGLLQQLGNQNNDFFGVSSTSSNPKSELISLLKDDNVFESFVNYLTNPNVNDDDDNVDDELQIKRSFRTMTLIVNDTESAQQMHDRIRRQQQQQQQQQNQQSHKKSSTTGINDDEEKLYENFVLSPTRAVHLAKKIFHAYDMIYKRMSTTTTTNNNNNNNNNDDLIHGSKPHLPHLNKTLSALLSAYPKQVVLASISSSSSSSSHSNQHNLSQTLDPMLQLQKYYNDYSSPIHTLVEIIIMGCTGRKKISSQQQQQQQQQQQAAMLGGGMLNSSYLFDPILISCGHRKKFVRSLKQWSIVNRFVDIITFLHETSNNNNERPFDDHGSNLFQENAAENTCDALLTIVESVCFPKAIIHPMLADMNNNKKLNISDEESAGEEELFSSLGNHDVIEKLTFCAGYNSLNDYDASKSIQADVASKALLGLFEIVSGKARKVSMSPTQLDDEVNVEDDDAIECKVRSNEPREVPGIDDNKLLKAGVTDSIHSALVSKMNLILQAMDINFVTKSSVFVSEDVVGELNQSSILNHAVNHPGKYTIERPFTSRRLVLITLFADIICYEAGSSDNVDRSAAIKALDQIMELPLPEALGGDSSSSILNPWPALCDLLFEYPENSMFGVQFYRMLHALCMTNHERSLKLIVQKCKFLSRAIKDYKTKSSGSTRGVLLKSLNALRLHSQSIGPNSFLRHYLDSHDGWRAFENDLKK